MVDCKNMCASNIDLCKLMFGTLDLDATITVIILDVSRLDKQEFQHPTICIN